jgi:hypothetical protein
VVIARDPDYGQYVRVDVKLTNGMNLILHCCKSLAGRYDQPLYGIDEIEWREIATVTLNDGSCRQITAGDLGLHGFADFRLALRAPRVDRPFFVLSIARAGMAYALRNVDKIGHVPGGSVGTRP